MQYFTGSLDPGGTAVYPVSIGSGSTISLALVSLADGAGTPLSSTITVGFGTLSTSDSSKCTTTSSKATGASLLNALSSSPASGSYCVAASDSGSLAGTATFAIRITNVVGTQTTTPSATVDTFGSFLQAGTAVTHTDLVGTANSTLTADLTATGSSAVVLRLSLGAWDGATCHIVKSVNTAPGGSPQVSVQVDPGYYCVQVADIGNVTADHITFSVSVGHS